MSGPSSACSGLYSAVRGFTCTRFQCVPSLIQSSLFGCSVCGAGRLVSPCLKTSCSVVLPVSLRAALMSPVGASASCCPALSANLSASVLCLLPCSADAVLLSSVVLSGPAHCIVLLLLVVP